MENEIGVKFLLPLSDTGIKKKIRMILLDSDCFHGGNHFIQVAGGVVSVTGVFFHPRDVQFLKKKITESLAGFFQAANVAVSVAG